MELAKKIMLDTATSLLSEYTASSMAKWEEMVAQYYFENATLEPTLALRITDNRIAINLRYITDYKLRSVTKNKLFYHISQAVSATDGKVNLASTTLQLLKIPELEVNLKK